MFCKAHLKIKIYKILSNLLLKKIKVWKIKKGKEFLINNLMTKVLDQEKKELKKDPFYMFYKK